MKKASAANPLILLEGCGPLGPMPAGASRPLRAQVLDRVRSAGMIPRVEVARDLGVSPASVSAIAGELIAAGLIEERDTPRREARRDGDGPRGRPPVALGVRGAAGRVAGLKLSDRVHRAVIVDFAGNILARASLEAEAFQLSPPALVDIAARLLDAALAEAGLTRRDLGAVGAAIPGLIDHERGEILWSPLLAARSLDFQARLEAALGLPATLDNDANLAALAELWFGAGRAYPDFVVVTIDHGVGMAMVLGNRLYRGASGLGMEIGHAKVQLDGALCRCGQRGCLEAYVADYALAREARTALNFGERAARSPQQLLEALHERAAQGDASARSIFLRAGRYLALGLANVANLIDPEVILLSGVRLASDPGHAQAVLEEMRGLSFDTGRPLPRVEVHAWDGYVWARGAAVMALQLATEAALGAQSPAASA